MAMSEENELNELQKELVATKPGAGNSFLCRINYHKRYFGNKFSSIFIYLV